MKQMEKEKNNRMFIKVTQVLIMLKFAINLTLNYNLKIPNPPLNLNSFKFITTLVLEVGKIETNGETKYSMFYSNQKAETIINENDTGDVFELIYITSISSIQTFLGKDLGWIIDLFRDPFINISQYNPFAGSSCIKPSKELDHP